MLSVTRPSSLLSALLVGLLAFGTLAADEDSAIPENLSDYRFVNALVINDPDNPLFGFHHFYVNDVGIDALQQGGPYSKGTIFLGLVYEVAEDGKTLNEGQGAAIALMEKVAGAEDTGGWRFAQLDQAGNRMSIDPVKDCFDCHTQVADRDYVFSQPLHVGELTNLALGGGGD